jgi:septal ring factor EnvC (AmiA/AmiB activator)
VTRRKNEADSNVEDVKRTKNHDPLKWFGLLVPRTLRQSADCFGRAAEIAVECANLQNEIRGVEDRKKYLSRRLKKQQEEKEEVEKDASETTQVSDDAGGGKDDHEE